MNARNLPARQPFGKDSAAKNIARQLLAVLGVLLADLPAVQAE